MFAGFGGATILTALSMLYFFPDYSTSASSKSACLGFSIGFPLLDFISANPYTVTVVIRVLYMIF